ncbi:MAG: EAL domain-containing protein, partial [Acidobacteriota bacterium]
LPDRVLEFDATPGATHTVKAAGESSLRRFISMYRTKGDRIWVSGKQGVASLQATPGRRQLQWREYPAPPEFSDFEQPREGEDGEVFAAAVKDHANVLVRFNGQAWTPFYKGKGSLLAAWRGADRDLWIQENDTILRLTAGREEAAERRDALSGSVLDVNPDTGGAFWVSTTQGIARYSPAVWRTPPAVRGPDMDTLVNSITDDAQGNVWFLSPHVLLRLQGDSWSRYPLPGGDRPSNTLTDAMRALPDGRLAVLSGVRGTILVFDPAAKRFETVRHPEGRVIRTFLSRRDGFVVQTQARGDPASWRLETFDGHSFHTWLDPGKTEGSTDVRALCEMPGGDLWIGDSSALGVFRDGKYHKVGPDEGFHLTGAFSLLEASPGRLLVGGRLAVAAFDGHDWRSLHQGFDRVRNILRSRDGTLWMASGTGLHRYRNGAWILNTGEDGLPSPVVYKVFEDRQGRIWAGTTRGISLFHPESDPDPPRTVLSEEMNAGVAAPDAPVHFVFSGVDKWNLTPPGLLLFSWRLDGGKWSEFIPGNSAAFRKVRAGAHRFEVRAMDRNGNVDPRPATLAFTVLVPWYRNAGFQTVAILTICIFALLLAAAAGNYLNRGKLLAQLEVSRKLDHDRKETLELIARREPLHVVLGRVAQLIASSEPGAGCLAAVASGAEFTAVACAGIPESWFGKLKFEGLGAAFRARANAASARADTTGISSMIGRSGVPEADSLWSREEQDFFGADYRTGSTIPIVSGGGEMLGAIEAYWPHRTSSSASRRALIEAMAGLAASAIENAHLYLELAYRAQYDSLTRLPNRLFFVERLRDAVERARCSGQKLALLYLDLDRFKQVNDSLGHGGGDVLLQQVASRLSGCLHKGDTIARMGGDEFMLLLEIEEEHVARDAAMRLLATLSRPVMVAGTEVFVTASIGISFFPGDGEDPATLQKHADSAMYRAKDQGKNRYQCFTSEMNTTAWRRLDMDRNLRQALDQGQFELHYQPQFMIGERVADGATASGEGPAGMGLAGMEALIRLRHPELGLLGAGDFIPIAEESGLILEIGSWVLREVCRQSAAWRRAGYTVPKIALNVSTLQFAHADFAQSVARALRESALPANALELEVTESVVMVHLEESVRQMEKLRSLGLTIALDDFGTGYSSLSYLHRLPIDVLKIDRSFIREIDAPSGTLPLVHSIVDLAHNLGLCAIAEGVERWSQHALLKEIDCDVAQGYLLSHPLSAADIEKFMTRAAGLKAVELRSR